MRTFVSSKYTLVGWVPITVDGQTRNAWLLRTVPTKVKDDYIESEIIVPCAKYLRPDGSLQFLEADGSTRIKEISLAI
jgi:hypothetical protein